MNQLTKAIERIEGEIVDVGGETYCNFCKQHIASGDCQCHSENVGLRKAQEILQEIISEVSD
jgi:hypothetical protein